MQFKEGNLQFTEELKFTDDYGRFAETEFSNFSDPENMENRKQDKKSFVPEKCVSTEKEPDSKEKDADIWMANERSGEPYQEEIREKEPGVEAVTSETSKNSDKNVEKDQNNEGKEKAARKTMVARMIRAKDLFSEKRGGKEPTGNALHDGNTGLVRVVTTYVNPKTWGKILAAKLVAALAPHILTVFMYLVVTFLLITIVVGMFSAISTVTGKVTGFVSRYSGRGHILSEESLSEEEIDEIVEDSGANGEQEAVIRYALSKVGYPYSQEDRASGSAYDCSSLVYYSWLSAGVDLSYGAGYPPTAAAEASKLYSYGTAVSTTKLDMRDMEPGDLVFYGGHDNKRFLGIYHVALYVGNGEVVEALNTEHGVVYETLRTNNIILVLRP